MFLARTV